MKRIPSQTIIRTVADLCVRTCHELPPDVRKALARAAETETSPLAREILGQLLRNADLSVARQLPLCQDTGLTVVFVERGLEVRIEGSLDEAVQAGVRQGYDEGYLRKSVVADPLKARTNTGTNLPAVIHCTEVPGDRLTLTVMAKGGGCENKSQFRMFRPTTPVEEILAWIASVATGAGADACPPLIVGVGIGGNFERCCELSKRALLRDLDRAHADPYYADLERTLLQRINASGVGPQGLGGDTTALAVLIETAPCHIASLPVAVNIECHSHRHRRAVL